MIKQNSQQNTLGGNKVLIFGGAGSLGTKLVEYYIANTDTEIHIASRDEAKHWDLRNKLLNNKRLFTHIGDMRDLARLRKLIAEVNPKEIIIASAMKQIDACEANPTESIATNILGIQNVLDAVKEHSDTHSDSNIKTVCFVSTDKAANPINVYGMCKSIAEKLVIHASETNKKVDYVVVRYGNVLSSKGSIIPLLLEQSRNPEVTSFTLTDDRMTRFIMSLEESVHLIMKAIDHGKSGEIWLPELPSMLIKDLMEIFAERTGKSIRITGIRPGEKLHEILFSDIEALKITKKNGCFVIGDSFINEYEPVEYSSKDLLISKEELKIKLKDYIS